jgi:formylglycine-generating enzyme required for sulfatase activity
MDDAGFAEIAKTYREAPVKPTLPEDAHKYAVQADSAIKDKDFQGAADRFAQALVVAPWWPQGRYNRALILGEVGKYNEACAEMRRYLLLVPEAPDARAAQDKIYEWQDKQERAEKQKVADVGDMVVVPGGTFLMGSPSSERDRHNDEGPQHRVSIKSFKLGKYDVTFAQWDACVGDGGCGGYSPADNGWGRGNRPVIYVSWNDAQQYMAWLSQKSGQHYRLPSEAEWEFAARAGASTAYYWGDAFDASRVANNQSQTEPVGTHEPNGLGLYDMAGNVFQWVADCYNESYAGAPIDGTPRTSDNCSKRVIRGGDALAAPSWLRVSSRGWVGPGLRGSARGFRLAQDR